mgnify:FL=1
MIYKGKEELRNVLDRAGNVVAKLNDEKVIKMINRSFGLKGTVTKVILS